MQSELIDSIASEMVLTVKAALGPVLARVEALERERKETAPLLELIASLERRIAKAEAVETTVVEVQRTISAIPETREALEPWIASAVQKVRDELVQTLGTQVEKAVAELPKPKDGKDGKDVSPEDVEALIVLHVERAVKALPVPQDGRSVTVEDVAPLVVAEVAKAVERIPVPQNGKDGIGLAGAVIDREGHLVLTLSDGTAKSLGLVVGKDADPEDVTRLVQEAVNRIPRPKDGEPGQPGQNGTLESLKVERTGDRSWRFVHKNGDPIEGGEFTAPIVLDRGVWDQQKAYEHGDGVTLGGSFWIAQSDTNSRPGTIEGSKSWRLAVKKGGDGRIGPKGDKGDVGPRGEKGIDGRNHYAP